MVRQGLIATLVAAILAILGAAGARADSLVFIKGGEVWISHADGSQQRQVTGAPNNWSWPTEDDAGAILAAGGQGGISAGVEDTPGSEIYRLNQQGGLLSPPQQTPGSYSTVACPTYPPVGLRVAPDGKHYAYHSWFCDRNITQIGTVGGQGFTSTDYMEEFDFPYWVGNSAIAMSRGGVQLDTCEPANEHYGCIWWTHELGEEHDYGYPWFSDEASSATGFDGIAVSRDGTKFASIEDNAADYEGAAQNVELRLWSTSGVPGSANGGVVSEPTFKCQLDLPADPQTTIWYYNAGPTFSPDGTRLAFAEPDGVHVANVANLNDCASIMAPLVIPGATQPFWSGAEEATDAGYKAPEPERKPTPRPDITPPRIGGLTVLPRRFAVAAKPAAGSARAARVARGAMVRYTLSEPARVAFDVVREGSGRRKGHRCVRATKALRRAPHCALSQAVATFGSNAAGGGNSLPFTGWIGHRKLTPGTYTLTATATDAAGNRGVAASARFTIVGSSRRRHR